MATCRPSDLLVGLSSWFRSQDHENRDPRILSSLLVDLKNTSFARGYHASGPFFFALVTAFAPGASAERPVTPEQVPEPLRPWIEWVLYTEPQRRCPFLYNAEEAQRCAWPTRLQLNLREKEGDFEILWHVYQTSEVKLPGGGLHWPQDVTADGKP
ncbi:MAG: hypothetical protein ACREX4_06785, partial [Gammaproteobacteria bacterium]